MKQKKCLHNLKTNTRSARALQGMKWREKKSYKIKNHCSFDVHCSFPPSVPSFIHNTCSDLPRSVQRYNYYMFAALFQFLIRQKLCEFWFKKLNERNMREQSAPQVSIMTLKPSGPCMQDAPMCVYAGSWGHHKSNLFFQCLFLMLLWFI